jgi:ubiquinone/menaquinone biosynthesis C-methylase UbiE/uncharacterized protein YbaR (Trm112 family)
VGRLEAGAGIGKGTKFNRMTDSNLLTQVLRCPISKGSVRWMELGELEKLNGRIAAKELRHKDGTIVDRSLESALVTTDGRFAYLVEDGIPILLNATAILLNQEEAAATLRQTEGLRNEKEAVQQFYNEIGWKKETDAAFTDAVKFEDLRPISREYIQRCNRRVGRYLKPGGRFLLDVASGPIQFSDYASYSDNFEYRICVDLSLVALKEAARKLGDKAICILADITNLPLVDNLVDSAISLHTIYHVPKDEQQQAFEEIFRVLEPGGKAVVVYHWGDYSLAMNIFMFHYQAARLFRKVLRMVFKSTGSPASSNEPKLYFYAHRYSWFTSQSWPLPFELVPWRSVSVPFLKFYIHPRLFGRQFLNLILTLEERFPRLAGRLGQYPMFVFHKFGKDD